MAFEPMSSFMTLFLVFFFIVFFISILRLLFGRKSEQTPTVVKEREIIREIVKIRCPYCNNLYEEKYDKCPYCGGKREP